MHNIFRVSKYEPFPSTSQRLPGLRDVRWKINDKKNFNQCEWYPVIGSSVTKEWPHRSYGDFEFASYPLIKPALFFLFIERTTDYFNGIMALSSGISNHLNKPYCVEWKRECLYSNESIWKETDLNFIEISAVLLGVSTCAFVRCWYVCLRRRKINMRFAIQNRNFNGSAAR